MVLKRIVADKRLELDRKYPHREIGDISSVPQSDRSFEAVLKKPHTGYIFECKKASPSKGLIRPVFDAAAIALEYGKFADAISVLTDEKYFQGSMSYLSAVREVVSVPVLCKDFILEPFQIVEARKAGADAILLMMSVLDDSSFEQCFAMASTLQVDALVEVRDETELARALALGARIIGINNRNLDNLEVDLSVTECLAPKVPKDKVVISESGISTHDDIRRLGKWVNGFLVGSALMAKPNITRACGQLVYGNLKVCGLTSEADALAVANLGVLYGGLIFAPSSKRAVTLEIAMQISKNVPLKWVGVFVDASPVEVAALAKKLPLAAVQLHGQEDSVYIESLRKIIPQTTEIWKAISVHDSIPALDSYGPSDDIRFLFDGKEGGSGKPFDWSLLEAIDLSHGILAGGIGAHNIVAAAALGAYAIDVNSKIENGPGRKDIAKLEAVLREVRGVK